jgi:ubiquinone/menaquinone biosynthesis C-methylase UbiE
MLKLFRKRRKTTQETPAAASHTTTVEGQGRRFRTDVPYLLPKDIDEINRLDLQHFILRQAFKGNTVAPVGNQLSEVLDVGCGTGRWGKEMAQRFPYALIQGLDLEEIRITGPVPENYKFVQGNILQRLPFPDESFAYVHQRLLVAGIPKTRWPDVIRELIRVTRRGGWLELVECGIEGKNYGPLMKAFFVETLEQGPEREIDPRVIPTLPRMMQDAGIRRVKIKTVDIPLGEWGGHLGKAMKTDLLSALDAMRGTYDSSLGDVDALLDNLALEWEVYHTSLRFFAFYGTK